MQWPAGNTEWLHQLSILSIFCEDTAWKLTYTMKYINQLSHLRHLSWNSFSEIFLKILTVSKVIYSSLMNVILHPYNLVFETDSKGDSMLNFIYYVILLQSIISLEILKYTNFAIFKRMKVKVAQSCPTLCEPIDYTVHEILQARILEWVAFPFSRRSSHPRDGTQVSHTAGRFFTSWATREAQEYWNG